MLHMWANFYMLLLCLIPNALQLCVVSNDQRLLESDLDMATYFFQEIFQNEVAPRVMSAIIALSIFGNIVVTTFTASRGKKCGC